MGLFTKKPQITTEEFCSEFYNKYVFSPPIVDRDTWEIYCESVHEQLLNEYPGFSVVDKSDFANQLRALYLEVIGIAWAIHFEDDITPNQSKCTRLYLLEHNNDYLWEMMEPYNQATAKSVVGGSDSRTSDGLMHITSVNNQRFKLFENYIKDGVDEVNSARTANRFDCKRAWQEKRIHIYLSFAFTDQLKCEINDNCRFAIMAIIKGFYDGFRHKLKEVNIVS